MSIKIKQGIQNCLQKIKDDIFDEDTIRTLLILTREHLLFDSLLREIAHFIAHSERTQGPFHKKANCRYAKLKLTEDQLQKPDKDEILKTITTEKELSDFLLGGVSVEKIESKLFEILYTDGLEDISEEHLFEYTNFKKDEVREIFKNYYVKKDGYHFLKTELTKYENILVEEKPKIRNTIDKIQKVVRGSIEHKSFFEQSDFIFSITHGIEGVIDKFNLDKDFIQVIKSKAKDILLCVLALLHDSKFIFYDKKPGTIYLCFYEDYKTKKTDDIIEPSSIYSNGVLALYVASPVINAPLVVSELKIKDYVTKESFEKYPNIYNMFKIDFINAIRKNGALNLTYET